MYRCPKCHGINCWEIQRGPYGSRAVQCNDCGKKWAVVPHPENFSKKIAIDKVNIINGQVVGRYCQEG